MLPEARPVKYRQLESMCSDGKLRSRELAAASNMMGRGLSVTLDDHALYFQTRQQRRVAELPRGGDSARVYASACTPQETERFMLGLQTAGYGIETI